MPIDYTRYPRVVVVDDEEVIREILRRRLTADGLDIVTAEDGEEAVALIGQHDFVNLVITDIKMPGLDGVEVLKRTKAASPDTEVIVMTAYASTETAIEALRLGAYDYLQKPFEHLDEVSHKVKHALRQQRLEFQNREMLRKLDEMNRGLKQIVISRTNELSNTVETLRRTEKEAQEAVRRYERAAKDVPAKLRERLTAIEHLAVPFGAAGGEAAAAAANQIVRVVNEMREQVARLADASHEKPEA